MAHDFNNLLTIITGNSEILLTAVNRCNEAKRDVRKRYDESNERSGARSALTQQLLACSATKAIGPKSVICDLNALIAASGDDPPLIGQRTLVWRPPWSDGLGRTKSIRIKLRIRCMNLVVNARDAMPAEVKPDNRGRETSSWTKPMPEHADNAGQ